MHRFPWNSFSWAPPAALAALAWTASVAGCGGGNAGAPPPSTVDVAQPGGAAAGDAKGTASGTTGAARAPGAPSAAVTKAFAQLRDETIARWLAASPSWGRKLGLHEFDGKVAPRSAAAVDQEIADEKKGLTALSAIDKAALSPDDALDLALLKQHTEENLFEAVDRDFPHKSPQFYEELFEVNDYVDRDYAPLAERAQRLLEHEEAALKEVPHFYENIRLPLSKPVAEVAAKNFAGYATYLRGDLMKLVKGAGDAAFQARFAKTNEQLAVEAMKISAWLKKEAVPKGDASHVLGRERYEKLLRVQEGLTMPLADFKKMGEDNLAANRKAYEELAKTTKQTRPKANELLAEATKVMEGARKFIVDKKIVDVASDDAAVVKETPPYARWNSASLEASGPFEKVRSAFYYVTLPDPSWPKKEQEEYVFGRGTLVATTVHEVYPGHFIQHRWSEKAPSKPQQILWSYSFGEGWAHYTEQMMIEEGFMDSPEIRLGQLSDALLRNCRFVVSYGMHVEGMTLDAGIKRFVDECHIDKATAREQTVRGTFDPGYFAYTLGKLQILALRDEAKKKLGSKFTLQRFHDALLSHGSPPVALMHDRVLRELETP